MSRNSLRNPLIASRWSSGAIRVVCASLTASLIARPAISQVATSIPPPTEESQTRGGDASRPRPATDQGGATAPAAVGASQAQAPELVRLRPWRLTPRLSVTETYTDNVTLAQPGAARSDWVTNVSPGLRIEGTGPRLRGFLDYRIQSLFYANDSRLNSRRNALDSRVTVEVLENWFFVDARASISQQNRTAFAAVASDVAIASGNRVETTVFQLSPYLRGRISDIATYQLRFNATEGSSRGAASSSTGITEWRASMRSASPSAKIGWTLDGTALTINNDTAGKSQSARARGSLIYQYEPQLHFSFYEGIETTNFAGSNRQTTHTPGLGVAWTPTSRTEVAAIREKRFFGQGQTVLLRHRTPSMAFQYSDNKELAAVPNLIAASGPGSLFAMISDLLAASIPDLELRTQAVNSRLERSALPADSSVATGFQTNRAFLRQNRQASAALLGATNTITLIWSRQDQQAVGVASGPPDSFASNPSIRQQTLRAAWTHRVSAVSSVTLVGSRLHAEGLTGVAAESTQNTVSLLLSSQIEPKTIASVGGRHGTFESTVAGNHRENAVLGTIATRF